MSGADVTVVMVTWNSAPYLDAALRSLKAQRGAGIELIAVDNASRDTTLNLLAALAPDATVIRNHGNRGFAAAANQGIAAAHAPYVLLLNPDVVLDPDYCRHLRDALRDDRNAASASGTLFSDANRDRVDSTGHVAVRAGMAWNRHAGARPEHLPTATNEVFGVSAAAAMYRRAALDDVGGPDGILAESFFAYLEDVDLDWRLRWRGWRSLHVPQATAVHRRSASGARRSGAIRRHHVGNELLLLARVYPRPWLLAQGAELARFWAGRLARSLAAADRDELRGLGDAARLLPLALRVRRQVMRTRRVPDTALEAWLHPRPWPWLPAVRR